MTKWTYKNDTPDFDCSLYRYLVRGIEDTPQLKVLSFMGKHMRSQEFLSAIRHMAAYLRSVGVQEGDVVTLVMPNLPSAVVAFYAINYAGAIISVLHPLTPAAAILENMRSTGSRHLVCFDKLYPYQHPLLKDTDIHVTLLGAGTYYRGILRWIIDSYNGCTTGHLRHICGKECAKRVVHYYPSTAVEPLAERAQSGERTVLYLHSGGTTGTPKSIIVTNRMLNSVSLGIIGLTHPLPPGSDTMLMVLPIFHGFGIGVCMHATLPHGIRVVTEPSFRPHHMAHIIRREKVTLLAGVPTMFEKLLATRRIVGRGYSQLRNAYCGGDILDQALKQRFDETMQSVGSPCRLYQGYGLAECVAVCSANSPLVGDISGSIGRPIRGVQMCILDENGQPAADGVRGEIAIAGDTVMQSYLQPADEVFAVVDGVRWLKTGDCGYRKGDVFYYVGRFKRMSIIAGVNVYHQEVEKLASEVEGVVAAAVTERWHKGKCHLVLWLEADPEDTSLKGRVLAHLSSLLTRYAIPREIKIETQLPRTAVGKIDYRSLSQ